MPGSSTRFCCALVLHTSPCPPFPSFAPADIFLSAAEQLGVHPSNCVVIEDAVAGVQAARAAGGLLLGPGYI